MALSIQSKYFDTSTGTGTQDFTITGFGTPKGAIFISTRATNTAPHSAHAYLSIGAADGTREWCVLLGDEDAQTTTDTKRGEGNDLVLGQPTTTAPGTLDLQMSFNSWITDGVRLDIDNTLGSARGVIVILFGGTDINNFYAGMHDDLGTAASAQDITAPGFEADLVFSCGNGRNTAPGVFSSGNELIGWFGCWSNDDATQKCAAIASQNNQTNNSTVNSIYESDSGATQIFNDSQDWLGTFSSNANGFTVTPNASAGSDILSYVAIEWATTPSVELVDVTLPATGDYSESGFTFQPEFGFIAMTEATTADSLKTTGDGTFSFHAIESGQCLSGGIGIEDAVATTTNTASFSTSDFFIGDPDATTTKSQGALSSIDSNGWTIGLNAGTNDGVQRKGWALGIAESTGTSVAPLVGRHLQNLMAGQ